jgi:outer membrane lipoprotein LolB
MRRCAALLSTIALLSACSAIAPRAPLPDDVQAVRDFELTGRVAVRLEDRGYSARLRWQHTLEHDSLRLYSPIGSVLATLEANPAGATLVTADRKTFHSEDVQGLTRDVLGWDLPLQGLQHWVIGRPDPDHPVHAEQRDSRGRLITLRQQDWDVAYPAYVGDSGLPSSVVLRRRDLSLKLIVDRWNLASGKNVPR